MLTLYPKIELKKILSQHPSWLAAESIFNILVQRGYKTYFAGGCVRDALLGIIPHDLDLATEAKPEEIENFFAQTVDVGKIFGVMRVLINNFDIEVATFRSDGAYVDGRRPVEIVYNTPEEDAQRRDFTINALFFDPIQGEVLDYVSGVRDLELKILSAVGNPKQRFKEDYLRVIRALRFAARFEFIIESSTEVAIKENVSNLHLLSRERIRDEIEKIYLTEPVIRKRGHLLCLKYGVLRTFELFEGENFFAFDDFMGLNLKSAKEMWLCLFWASEIDIDNNNHIKYFCEKFKLSNEVKNKLIVAGRWANQLAQFENLRLGEKILLFSQPDFEIIFGIWKSAKSSPFIDSENFRSFYYKYQKLFPKGILPRPRITGKDIPIEIEDKKRGEYLKVDYIAQLEEYFNSGVIDQDAP